MKGIEFTEMDIEKVIHKCKLLFRDTKKQKNQEMVMILNEQIVTYL